MRVLRSAGEEEMVLAFLRAELASSRFAGDVAAALARQGADRSLVHRADLSDAEANLKRHQALEDYRGPRRGPRAGIFGGLPDDVAWSWVALTREELLDVRYIDWEYWLEVTGGTRRPADAIRRMRGRWDVPGDEVHEIAQAVGRWELPHEIIVVGCPPGQGLVVL
jgi:hypothetical protein